VLVGKRDGGELLWIEVFEMKRQGGAIIAPRPAEIGLLFRYLETLGSTTRCLLFSCEASASASAFEGRFRSAARSLLRPDAPRGYNPRLPAH
jgi:hypothetical protein